MDVIPFRTCELPEQDTFDQVRQLEIASEVVTNAIDRGWDDLFNKCSENLNSLTAMKLSPYYKGS
jgi:hypothetical protein